MKTVRIVLDVNILVNAARAVREKRTASTSLQTLNMFAPGTITGLSVQMVASHLMVDTLLRVLVRAGASIEAAAELAQSWVDTMRRGPEQLDPYVILGGSPVLSVRDLEDGGILATAYAGRAEILVTDNLRDFQSGAAEQHTTTLLRSKGAMRQLSVHIHRWPDGFEVCVCHPHDFLAAARHGILLTPEAMRRIIAETDGWRPRQGSNLRPGA
jgi:hypothetical protein